MFRISYLLINSKHILNQTLLLTVPIHTILKITYVIQLRLLLFLFKKYIEILKYYLL